MRLLFYCNVDWFFVSHRLPLAIEAQKQGFEVYIAAQKTDAAKQIIELGLNFIPIETKRASANIFQNIKIIFQTYKLFKKIKPDIIHNITIKPVLFGSIIARIFYPKTRIVNALSGMGYLFTNNRSGRVLKLVYEQFARKIFNHANMHFIFQNQDDAHLIIQLSNISKNSITIIPGSGIDLHQYIYTPEPSNPPIKILLHSRMLWDKGIKEYIEVATFLKQKYKEQVEFILCGGTDENKTSIPESTLRNWDKSGFVKWIGHQSNIIQIIQDCHIVLFPSYREGFPKSLIEASAIGRPIIVFDAIGSRDAVANELNGFVVEMNSVSELIKKTELLINDNDLRNKMGNESRKIAEERYSIKKVIETTIQLYQK
jgi:glycosyltransferase involved in cell wall biosynthesis